MLTRCCTCASLTARSTSWRGWVAARSRTVLAAEVTGMPWRRVMSWGWRVARWMTMPGRLCAPCGADRDVDRALAGRAKAPEHGGWVVGDDRAGAARKRRRHGRRVRGLERADEVDAAISPAAATRSDPVAIASRLHPAASSCLVVTRPCWRQRGPGFASRPRHQRRSTPRDHPRCRNTRPQPSLRVPTPSPRPRNRRNSALHPNTFPTQPPFAGALHTLVTEPRQSRNESAPLSELRDDRLVDAGAVHPLGDPHVRHARPPRRAPQASRSPRARTCRRPRPRRGPPSSPRPR